MGSGATGCFADSGVGSGVEAARARKKASVVVVDILMDGWIAGDV